MDVNRILEILLSGKLDLFYKSKEWMSTRLDALKRDKNECQHCKAAGRMRKSDCVHHIKHLKDRPDLALKLSNLVSLCNSCHNVQHPEKQLKTRKKKVINIEERW